MADFKFSRNINAKGKDIIAAYETYICKDTPDFVRNAVKVALMKEKCKGVYEAVNNPCSIEDFREIVAAYNGYNTGDAEFQAEAMKFVEENLDKDIQASVVKSGATKVLVQKRVGMKLSEVQNYFGVTEAKAKQMFSYGFIETFVDTFIRKQVNEILARVEIPDVSIKVSDVYKVPERNLYNLDINFRVAPSKLNSDMCKYISEALRCIEQYI